MAFHDGAAVGNGEEIGFAPIEAGVEADGVPEIAGAAKCEGKENTNQRDAGCADGTLAGIAQVDSAEAQRKKESGGPETDAVGQRELSVAAEHEFLEKSNDGE